MLNPEYKAAVQEANFLDEDIKVILSRTGPSFFLA